MRRMHVFKGGGSESPIYKSYPFDLYEGYAGMRGRRLPVELIFDLDDKPYDIFVSYGSNKSYEYNSHNF